MMKLFERLWSLPRSISGNSVRDTLNIINELVPLKKIEYKTGMRCFDWTVPKEWNIKDAYIKNNRGEKIIDFKKNNLHLVSYSVPINKVLSKDELMEHIHTLPEIPDSIPYYTSYYKEYWGFCLEHNRLGEFNDKEYEVVIDSTLEDGHLTIGEGYLQGESDEEILLSTYVCHPSLANDNLSGPVLQTFLYKYLLGKKMRKYSYRLLYIPETIGAIAYLNENGERLKQKVIAGYVITCVGDKGSFTYKKSRQGNSLADKAALNMLKSKNGYKVINWSPTHFASDERQYCSIGFNLPVGSLTRSRPGTFREYHTSLDNMDFITEDALKESLQAYIDIIEIIEINNYYINTNPYCEPQLGKRSLYPNLGASKKINKKKSKFLYLLGYSDGKHDVIDIANKMGIPANEFGDELNKLIEASLLIKKD